MSKCEKRCKDCIHCEVCEHNSFLVQFDKNNIAYCTTFKDKSLVVELPVGVGQKVYIIDDTGDEDSKPYPLEVRVIACGVDECGTWVKMKLPLGLKQSQYIGAVSIGTSVFLTEEEAEAKLREVENG